MWSRRNVYRNVQLIALWRSSSAGVQTSAFCVEHTVHTSWDCQRWCKVAGVPRTCNEQGIINEMQPCIGQNISMPDPSVLAAFMTTLLADPGFLSHIRAACQLFLLSYRNRVQGIVTGAAMAGKLMMNTQVRGPCGACEHCSAPTAAPDICLPHC